MCTELRRYVKLALDRPETVYRQMRREKCWYESGVVDVVKGLAKVVVIAWEGVAGVRQA